MRHPTRAGIGLIRLGDSDFVPQNPEDDLRGKAVAPFDTKVAPPPTDESSDAYALLPYGNAKGTADPRDSSLRDIHRPY